MRCRTDEDEAAWLSPRALVRADWLRCENFEDEGVLIEVEKIRGENREI